MKALRNSFILFFSLLYHGITPSMIESKLINEWIGHQCCHLAQTDPCRHSCLNAQSIHHLDGCNEELKACLKNEMKNQTLSEHKCCSHSLATKHCRKSCSHLFLSYAQSSTVSKRHKNKFLKNCKNFDEVIDCAKHHIRGVANEQHQQNTPLKTFCCNKTSDLSCSQSCNQLLKTTKHNNQMIDALVAVCGLPFAGEPSPNDGLWHCFLSFSDSVDDRSYSEPKTKVSKNKNLNINGNINRRKNRKKSTERRQSTDLVLKASKQTTTYFRSQYRFGMDSAKLICCSKARSDTCRTLCHKTWSDQWLENWHQFDSICQYSPQETDLIQCLDDVEGLCQLGCQSLDFCQAFNHRPNQLFRKCDSKSDMAAKEDYESWMKGVIHFNVIDIPVKSIAECHPEFWKLIACSIHMKPCLDQNHYNNICRSSCIDIISECIDSNRIPSSLVSAQTICDIISTNDSIHCIDIKTFLDTKQTSNEDLNSDSTELLINACNPNPCSSDQICLANNQCMSDQCLPFRCVPACRLGEMSPFLVESGAIVKLLDMKDNCYQLCKCEPRGHLIDCHKVCDQHLRRDCALNGHNITHSTKLVLNDRQCVCFNQNIQCFGSDCIEGCPQHYTSVCATNGQTFPNRCYAECNGFSPEQYVDGRCHTTSDCIKCAETQRCVKKSHICLTSSDCPQYECISDPIDCQLFGTNHVCDTNGLTHHNLCWLLRKRQTFAYYGKCLVYCSQSGPVCAMNGITYQSECESLSHSVPVDYYSECNHTKSCHHIVCPQQHPCPDLQFEYKLSHNCCPVCGSVAQLMYDNKFINSLDKGLKSRYSVTVEALAESLSHLLRLFGCQSFTHLNIDGSLILLVRPTHKMPTISPLRQCGRELVRVVTLINNQSPVISLKFPLSLLISGRVLNPNHSIKSEKSCSYCKRDEKLVILVILMYTLKRIYL